MVTGLRPPNLLHSYQCQPAKWQQLSISTNWRLGFPLNPRALFKEDSPQNGKGEKNRKTPHLTALNLFSRKSQLLPCTLWRLETGNAPIRSFQILQREGIKPNKGTGHPQRQSYSLADQYTPGSGENSFKKDFGAKGWQGGEEQSSWLHWEKSQQVWDLERGFSPLLVPFKTEVSLD